MKIPHKFGHIRVNFLQSVRLQWMISIAFQDVSMAVVPEGIQVLDCSYIYV